jgi:hypothetical protein
LRYILASLDDYFFPSPLVDLNNKYDTLVIENAELNKTVQSKNIEVIRLQAYKEAVTQIESKHSAERALILKAQAKKDAREKTLALTQKAEQKVLAAQAISEVNQAVGSVTETTTKLESKADVIKVESVK